MNQSRMVEVKQVSCYATSMLCIGFFHKGSKGESVKHGGGKTSELLCNKLWKMNTGRMTDCVT